MRGQVGQDCQHTGTDDHVPTVQSQQKIETSTEDAVTDFKVQLMGELDVLVVQENTENDRADERDEEDFVIGSPLEVETFRGECVESLALLQPFVLKISQCFVDLVLQSEVTLCK